MSKKLQNIILTALMLISVPLVVSGETYILGLLILGGSVIASFSLLLGRNHGKSDRLKMLSWLALGAWLLIVITFFAPAMGINLFGSGLEGLSNWAKTSFLVGVLGILLTSIQLFRVNN